MKQRSIGGRPLAFLSSLRLAVVTMVTLGSICGFATFYEMRNGTPAVQRDIYQTPWFALLLALLGTNVVAVMASRYPWTKHHIGFLTAHVGILAILLGSVLSLYGGLDSNMPIYEGETTDRVMLLQKALQVTAPNGARGSCPVVFEKSPPGPGHEKRFSVPGSDIVLVADDYQPHVSVQESELVRSVVPEKPPVKEERRRPAVSVHLESPGGRSESEWVLWGEQRGLRLGDQYASVGYQSPERTLPFSVTLIRFNNESYPGSRMAATYESTVRIDDPERGSFETLISMNHPFHHRGYIFFQSSFVEGRPMMSIFSVARAPGLPLVYLGVVLIATGVVWMFYVKPYLAKRQAALALAAHRAREISYEEKPSDPLPAHARPGEPAPSGA